MKRIILTLFFGVLLLPIRANAFIFEPVIDNCSETIENGIFGMSGNGCGTIFKQGNEVAYQFKVDSEINVTSIEGWMSYISLNNVNEAGANLVVYNGTLSGEHIGSIPGGDKIFEQNFRFPAGPDAITAADWRGVYDINLTLPTGTYWASYEDGVQGTSLQGGSDPRLRFAATHTPEPATFLLFGAGAAWMVRRRKALIK